MSTGTAGRLPRVVAVGSSAGGLEALRNLLAPLPANAPMSIIVAQHLSPDHHSLLCELLARETNLEVEEIVDGRRLEPGRVYTTPPNRNVAVSDGALRLEPASARGVKPSVDRLFDSVAREFGDCAVAVVLSGTGSDGAVGVGRIRGAGGLVFVQDPAEAKYSGMPEAAIASRNVDAVLPVADIAARLVGVAEHAPVVPPPVRALDRIVAAVTEEVGLDFSGYKSKTLARRMSQRMAALNAPTLAAYEAMLEADAQELRALAQSWLISVTEFFRDPALFDALKDHIAAHFKDDRSPLRVWVPGCATGEEAYSLAILLRELVPKRHLQLFATDIDEQAIQTARRAVYPEAVIEHLDKEIIAAGFRVTPNGYQVEKTIRDRVVVSRHDLLRDPPFLALDLISCRNLLIYLKPAVQDQVFARFHAALRGGAVLFLGRSENAPDDRFETVDRRAKIYLNREPAREARIPPTNATWLRRPVAPEVEPAGAKQTFERTLAEALAPAAVLTDPAGMIKETFGRVDRYLTLKAGRVDMSLLALAPKAVAASLRAQLFRCAKSGKPSRGVPRLVEINGESVLLGVSVYPADPKANRLFAVVFAEGERSTPADDAKEHSEELQQELDTMRQNLQSMVEELETSNEELQALNEELQSTNEEMQASNEELQASNEELHSATEELTTVNDEMEQKSVEYALLVEEFEAIQNSLADPLVVLDRHGLVRRANHKAREMLGLGTSEDGSVFLMKEDARLSARLQAKVHLALRTKSKVGLSVAYQGISYSILITPFLTRETAERGAVLLFRNVTDLANANERLRQSRARLQASAELQTGTIDSVPAAVAHIGPDGRIIAVNRAWRDFGAANGLTIANSCVGVNYLKVSRFGQTPEATAVAAAIERVLAGENEEFAIEYPCHSPDQQRWFRCVVAPVETSAGRHAAVMHFCITETVMLRETVAKQVSALHSAQNAIFIADSSGRLDWANEAFGRLVGESVESLVGRPVMLTAAGGEAFSQLLLDCIASGSAWRGEIELTAPDGTRRTVHQTLTPIANAAGELDHVVCMHEDVTLQVETRERMRFMAEHDDLTGLWNRKSFNDRLNQAIRRQKPAQKIAVLFLDLDRFKDTNDTLGHLVGDKVLLEVAQRLRSNLRGADSLARFGGDEFVVFLEDMDTLDTITMVVERIFHSFNKPIEIDARSLFISASIGITIYPDDATTPEELLRNADLAMYRAKAEGRRGYRFFDQRLESEINARVEIERELNRCIANRELRIAFQPQWDLINRRITGAEALLRSVNPRLETVPMGRIIEIAEECGLILTIGQWIIKESIAQLHRWHQQGHPIRMSVNLSGVQFHQQDVYAILTESLKLRQIAPHSLKVEITESVLLNRSSRVRETLHALHGAGVGLVLDDFGTGYSSLSYLREFPIEAVKIDSSFLRGIGKKANDEAIVRGIIQLVHSLGLTVIAEGVETEEQAAFLAEHQCDLAQGFLCSPAVQGNAFEQLLRVGSFHRTQAASAD